MTPGGAPASSGTTPSDASISPRIFLFSASLRETYDTNRGTSGGSGTTDLSTSLDFSVFASHTSGEDTFSASSGTTIAYYESANSNTGGNGSSVGSDNQSLTVSQSVSLRDTHSFSERTSLSLGDDINYGFEPNIYQNAGTQFNNGNHVTNLFDGALSYQWTPRLGVTGNYSNTYVKYLDQAVAQDQDSDEQSAGCTLSYSLQPSLSVLGGGTIDTITYASADRGYTDLTVFGGLQWQATADISTSGRVGGTYVHPDEGSDEVLPYASLTLNWAPRPDRQFGLSYSHSISPSSQPGAQAAESDNVSATFSDQINTRLSGGFTASAERSDVSGGLAGNGTTTVSPTELTYYVGPNLSFNYNSFLSFSSSITYSGNSSQTNDRNYSRLEFTIGVSGTY